MPANGLNFALLRERFKKTIGRQQQNASVSIRLFQLLAWFKDMDSLGASWTNAAVGRDAQRVPLHLPAEVPSRPLEGQAVDERAFFRQARAIVADLFEHDARIYWTDMLVTVAVAYGCALLFMASPGFDWVQWLVLLVAGFALFRVGTFIHEIQHFPKGSMRRFSVAWNIICGIPMMTPSFMYDNHQGHHRHDSYGTDSDAEYLPLGAGPLSQFVGYGLQALLIPAAVGFRFLFLVPLSFFIPPLRRWLLERFSFFGIKVHYKRPMPEGGAKPWWALMDLACSLRVWGAVAVVPLGFAPWTQVLKLYLLGVMGLGLNYVRNLTAHRYRNAGARMTYFEQLLDSVNIIGHPLWTELWFPVGLRYHALHHLFPALPYHNLATAHRRLMAQLPADSPYRRTVYRGFFQVLAQLRSDSRHWRSTAASPG